MKLNIKKIFYLTNGNTFFVGSVVLESLSINTQTKGDWKLVINDKLVCMVDITYEYMPIRKDGVTLRTLVSSNFTHHLQYDSSSDELVLLKS